MFALPDAKRVRREDLASSSEDEDTTRDDQQDAELLAKLHARMAGMIELGSLEQPPTPAKKATADESQSEGGKDEDAEMGEDNGPEEFEFRLFSTTDPTTKIALVDEDELALQKDGAMARGRPLSCYIAEGLTPEAQAEVESVAVSGDEVVARATQRWWGMEMPWRVTAITTEGKKKASSTGGDEEAARRTRPGKKKRIAMRMKERERKKKAEEEEKAKMNKEEHLKEKKKRLNRLKKLRRRAKDKEAKQGQGEAGDDGSGSGSDGDE